MQKLCSVLKTGYDLEGNFPGYKISSKNSRQKRMKHTPAQPFSEFDRVVFWDEFWHIFTKVLQCAGGSGRAGKDSRKGQWKYKDRGVLFTRISNSSNALRSQFYLKKAGEGGMRAHQLPLPLKKNHKNWQPTLTLNPAYYLSAPLCNILVLSSADKAILIRAVAVQLCSSHSWPHLNSTLTQSNLVLGAYPGFGEGSGGAPLFWRPLINMTLYTKMTPSSIFS